MKTFVLISQDSTRKQKNVSALMKGITGLEIIVPTVQMIKKNTGWMNLIAVQNVHKIPISM